MFMSVYVFAHTTKLDSFSVWQRAMQYSPPLFSIIVRRLRVVRMQAAVGRGTEGLHPAVVELAGLHHAVTLPVHVLAATRRLLPLARRRALRAAHDAAHPLARGRPDDRQRRSLRNRQRLQLRAHHLPVPNRSRSDLGWIISFFK